jgi:hypothetical protein
MVQGEHTGRCVQGEALEERYRMFLQEEPGQIAFFRVTKVDPVCVA